MKKIMPTLLLLLAAPVAADHVPADATVEGEVVAREIRLQEPSGSLRVILFVRPDTPVTQAWPVECGPQLALQCAALEIGAPARLEVRMARDGLYTVRLLARSAATL